MKAEQELLHPVFKALLAAPPDPDVPPIEERSVEELRQEFANDMRAVDKEAPEVANIEDMHVDGPAGTVRVRIYTAAMEQSGAPVILFIHGGGFFRGNIDTHDSICRVLAAETGGIVVSPEYRRPPEDPFPAAVDDCSAVLQWLAMNADAIGGDPENISVVGDSAGGTHAAALTIKARDEGGPVIKRQILYYPSVDHATVDSWESQRLYGKGYWLDSASYCIDLYLPDVATRAHPLASPLHAESHAGLPPAYICTAGFDPLRDQGRAYADKLHAAGVPVDYTNFDNMLHGFVSCRGLVDEADECIRKSVEEI